MIKWNDTRNNQDVRGCAANGDQSEAVPHSEREADNDVAIEAAIETGNAAQTASKNQVPAAVVRGAPWDTDFSLLLP